MPDSEKANAISIIVPVAPSEPLDVVKKSYGSLKSLDAPESLEKSIYYVIDSENPSNDERIDFIEGKSPELIKRGSDEGRKASALNDALEVMKEPKYVVVCDIDSRPAENFLTECMEKLESKDDYFMASCPREILNKDRNIFTSIISTEFKFFEDMQRISNDGRGFNHFNGPIAVIDGSFAVENGFNEDVVCEDTYFTEKGYVEGQRAVMTMDTVVGEQAVTNLGDLYSQKVRWMAGAREGIENFTKPMIKSDNPISVKLSWFSAMLLPFFAFLFSPLSLLYGIRLMLDGRSPIGSLKAGVAGFFYSWFISFCGVVVLKKRIFGENVGWVQAQRENL